MGHLRLPIGSNVDGKFTFTTRDGQDTLRKYLTRYCYWENKVSYYKILLVTEKSILLQDTRCFEKSI